MDIDQHWQSYTRLAEETRPKPSCGAQKPGRQARWRAKLFASQNGLCALCGQHMGRDVTLDHIRPRSKGGSNAFRNMQAAHMRCNSIKGDKEPTP